MLQGLKPQPFCKVLWRTIKSKNKPRFLESEVCSISKHKESAAFGLSDGCAPGFLGLVLGLNKWDISINRKLSFSGFNKIYQFFYIIKFIVITNDAFTMIYNPVFFILFKALHQYISTMALNK